MKLLRLTTSDGQCNFDNILKSDLIVGQNSKIALSNASFTNSFPELYVDENNDTISYNLGPSEKTCEIAHNTYYGTTSSGLLLLQEIYTKMNSKLTLEGKEFGAEWKLYQEAAAIRAKVKIWAYDFNDKDYSKSGTISISGTDTDTNRVISSSVASVDMSSRCVSSYALSRGSGVFRGKINILSDNTSGLQDNGFEMILSTSSDNLDVPNLSTEQNKYSIRIQPDGTGFKYMYRAGTGSYEDPAITPENFGQTDGLPDANNDVVEINISEGKVNGVVYQASGSQTLFSVPYDGNEHLFPIIIMYGASANCGLFNTRATLRHTFIDDDTLNADLYNSKNNVDDGLLSLRTDIPLPPALRPGTITLDMSKAKTIAKFLGYDIGTDNYIFKRPNARDVATFSAEEGGFTYESADSYVVEFQSSQLESYDGFSHGRYSILKVIPNTTTNSDNRRINYEASNLEFIDLSNRNPITLRNIRARVLKSDLTPVNTVHLSVLTLLIKAENET